MAYLTPFLISILFFTCLSGVVSAQKERLRQVKNNPVKQKSASTKAIATFVTFFEYVKKDTPDIVTDTKAQERWLSKSLRREMMEANAAWVAYLKKYPNNKPDGPDNASFADFWNQPTTYSIVSTRQYDYRNATNPNAFRTMIDVLFEWGNEDDGSSEYPGVRNLHTFVFVFEDGRWKLDDIYIFDDEFTEAESLHQYFSKDRPQ
jgi:hypothetical protein